jgi:iron complex outermembrane recepter protein
MSQDIHGTMTASALLAALLAAPAAFAQGAPPPTVLETVQVTGTRFGEPVQEVPHSIGIVTGRSLRERGVTDLRTALSLLAGVSIVPGGDAGPAGAVPGLLGLREIDDFLLLIDGIPAGGAFLPAFESISLVNVERIEVLRGTAPVYFGTTAFAGTINVIHHAAGRADSSVSLSIGSRGSLGLSGAAVVSPEGVKQSVAGEVVGYRLADPRAGFDKAQGSYRLATEIGSQRVRADVNVLLLRQKPASPSPIDGGHLDPDIPVDFNQNPSGARIDTDRWQVVLGHETPLGHGRGGTTVSYTDSRTRALRGFLIADFGTAVGDNAAGYTQSLRLRELFIDTHVTAAAAPGFDLTVGLNQLTGLARQDSTAYTYLLPLDGAAAPSLNSGTRGESTTVTARRGFFGAYAQSRLKCSEDINLLAGLRWNRTDEHRSVVEGNTTSSSETLSTTRLSGSLGGSWRVWQDKTASINDVVLHVAVGSTFQPSQIAFGPAVGEEPLIKPETQRSLTVGVRGDALDGRLDLDLGGFLVDFDNQPISANVNGLPVISAGGKNRYKGLELEAGYRPAAAWSLTGHATWSDARYRDFSTLVGGVETQLEGKQIVMSSRLRAGAGLVFAPDRAWRASLTATHVGARWLDRLNTARAGAFTLLDVSVGYRFDGMTLTLSGSNLSDRRDPVATSELGEEQFYRMTGRHFDLVLSVPFK